MSAAVAGQLALPSRRAVFGAGAALLAGATVAVAAGRPEAPDAGLLALCGEFHRLNAILLAAEGAPIDDNDADAWNDAYDRRWAATDTIEDMPARTAAGHAAKATVALALIDEENREAIGSDMRFARAVLAGIAGSASA